MNRTIYIPADKLDLWRRAERTARLKGYRGISDMIVHLLAAVAFSDEEIDKVDALVNRRDVERQE